MVRAFLDKTSAEWMWMLDSDMVFTPDVLDRLLEAGEKYSVVGALCFARNDTDEVYPTLYRRDDEGVIRKFYDYPDDELVEVDGTGAACLLIHRSVLLKIADRFEEPYVWFQDTSENGYEIGEDVEFCLRAKEVGYTVAVHTGIQVGHVKSRIYTEADYVRP